MKPPSPSILMWNALHTQCIPQETYTLTLQSNKPSIEPSGTTAGDGNSSTTFTVTVIDQSTQQGPTKPVQVKLIVHKPTDGGHDHDDPSRPRGGLNGTECTTDEPCVTLTFNGGIATQTVNYKAPIVYGKHSFSATCDKCGNSPQTANLEVKVEGLEPIPASTFYTFVGSTTEHSDNHYLTPTAAGVLWRIAVSYQAEKQFKLLDPVTGLPMVDPKTGYPVAPPVLHVNDASLIWGGKFDINGSWKGDHKEHRRGTVADIRANNKATAIPSANFEEFEVLAARYQADAYLETPSLDRRHYHLRLLNRKE